MAEAPTRRPGCAGGLAGGAGLSCRSNAYSRILQVAHQAHHPSCGCHVRRTGYACWVWLGAPEPGSNTAHSPRGLWLARDSLVA
jgi:hypothetical protein